MTRTICLLALCASPAIAQDTAPLPMNYEIFEAAVPHIDMSDCPPDLAAEGRFCRLVLLNDQLQIFGFSEEGEQPMVAYRAMPSKVLAKVLN
ncbi:hypothetical protein [Paracoccus sp. (in: a-proteobacteria)]|uniref:hypothetical protein n=1 Tax=Paracoccus sp. TaxID=267 RepID=UPI0035AE4A36